MKRDTQSKMMYNVSGQPIGHVPRSLAPYFRDIQDKDVKVFLEVTGLSVSSDPQWQAPHDEGWCWAIL